MSELSVLADHVVAVTEALMEIMAKQSVPRSRLMPASAKLQALASTRPGWGPPKIIALTPDTATILHMAAMNLSDIEVEMRNHEPEFTPDSAVSVLLSADELDCLAEALIAKAERHDRAGGSCPLDFYLSTQRALELRDQAARARRAAGGSR